MIISCIGDSLTEGDYGIFGKSGIANVHTENYPYFLSRLTGFEVRNFGKCGFNSSSYLSFYKGGNVDVKNSDKIIIMLGTNGGLNPNESVQGNDDYKELIELCKKDEPKAEIILCTPPHATENPEYSNCGYMPNIKNAAEFVRKFARDNGYKLIDIEKCPEFCAENEKLYQPNDGLHFGKEGYMKLAQIIRDNI